MRVTALRGQWNGDFGDKRTKFEKKATHNCAMDVGACRSGYHHLFDCKTKIIVNHKEILLANFQELLCNFISMYISQVVST